MLKLKLAKKAFWDPEGRDFEFVDCWELLRDVPKFQSVADSAKKPKKKADEEVKAQYEQRPMGNKKSLALVAQKQTEIGKQQAILEKIKLEAAFNASMEQVFRKNVAIAENAAREAHERHIMSVDISSILEEDRQEYYQYERMKIIARIRKEKAEMEMAEKKEKEKEQIVLDDDSSCNDDFEDVEEEIQSIESNK
ncbi:uncharacterized protein B0P05DRAFT_609119 [Gilbertella persicaria]|uniref:uncharacterized protein n=1 Tax=Gilbertella persicaria TaxID=101096 RepID=UPI00221E9FFC|nr:uncharacterized protein B0P05DRAFT_609119 [Gilbertella persicaria]KAI8084177.1 hypothetical protein B0P05DRAFT_609119 [Gilbertella persicaria]